MRIPSAIWTSSTTPRTRAAKTAAATSRRLRPRLLCRRCWAWSTSLSKERRPSHSSTHSHSRRSSSRLRRCLCSAWGSSTSARWSSSRPGRTSARPQRRRSPCRPRPCSTSSSKPPARTRSSSGRGTHAPTRSSRIAGCSSWTLQSSSKARRRNDNTYSIKFFFLNPATFSHAIRQRHRSALSFCFFLCSLLELRAKLRVKMHISCTASHVITRQMKKFTV